MTMNIIPSTARRAESRSPDAMNSRIHDQTVQRIAALVDNPAGIRRRLTELDHEWDVERCLETGSATLTLTGLFLATTVHRRWLWLSATVQMFFLQHAIQGWCPPLPLFRAAGVRTQHEIEAERHALKALLGEYAETASGGPSTDSTNEARAEQTYGKAMA